MRCTRDIFQMGKTLLSSLAYPDLEARLFMQACTSRTEKQFFTEPDFPVPYDQEKKFFAMVNKRLQGIPLAYLIGEKEFWGLPFKVSPDVLIPRPETELLVENVLKNSPLPDTVIVDIGTGSGNIAISLAKHLEGARIYATDISKQALHTARLNAERLRVKEVTFLLGDLFLPLETMKLKNKCDFIVSNPPYISQAEWEELAPEIKDHEPWQALVPGKTGLELIKEIIFGAGEFLRPGGHLLIEIGYGQKNPVADFFGKNWGQVKCCADLAGIPRVFKAQKRAKK